jgi:phosphoesterase RecJ-like protein
MPDQYQAILDVLSRSKRVLITTHVRPDGDALGSTAALVLGLRAKGIAAHVVLLSAPPEKYSFVFRDSDIPYTDIEKGWPDSLSLESFDAFLVVDTGTWSQLPGLRERIEKWPVPKLVVDHHLTQENWADAKLVVKEAAAAGEIVAELLEQWDVPLTETIARSLFLAIASDTGWFHYSNTRPFTLRLAARLIEAGVDTDMLYQLLYQNERAERVTLQAGAQQTLELLADQRLAVMRVAKADFENARASMADTESLINVPLQIRAVEVSILFVEPTDGSAIRVSLRSKGKIDVSKFAEKFGGGGHARAAGLKLVGSLDSVHDRVVLAMVQTIQNSPA